MAGKLKNGYSVLMPVYCRENPQFLRQSIESMLAQTLPFEEFVLVCDGPLTDGLEEVMAWAEKEMDGRFRCVRLSENQGVGKALKAGLSFCRCRYVARMDSDDISRPDRCERQIKVLEEKKAAIVGGSLEEFFEAPGDSGKCRILPETPGEIRKFARKRNPFNHPCVMFDREAVERCGSYADFPGFEDYELWVRMLKNGCEGWNLPGVVLDMRVGNGMYARRGGAPYLKSVLNFQRHLRKTGFIGTGRYLCNCAVRLTGSLIPGGLRERLYGAFLRRKADRRK